MKWPLPKKRNYSECKIQTAIVDYIRAVAPQCLVFHIPNYSRSAQEGDRLKRAGMVPGIPDLQILLPGGSAFFLEVKTDKGKPNKAQRELYMRFLTMGQPYAVVRSIDDVRAALSHWKIETKDVFSKSFQEA